jgi:predicted permease
MCGSDIPLGRRVVHAVDALWQDLRYSARGLRRAPGFSLVLIGTLALAVGANTALFSVFNAVVLRQLPVREPHRLVVISANDARNGQLQFIYARTLAAYQEQQRSFDALSLYAGGGLLRTEARGAVLDAGVEAVTPEYFDMLGVRPVIGRLISSIDGPTADTPSPVVVLAHRFWQRQFSADPSAVGETLKVAGTPLTIIGVTQRGFLGLQVDGGADFFVTTATLRPIAADPRLPIRARNVIGRLRAGVTLEEAAAEVRALWPAIQRATLPAGLTPAVQESMRTPRITVESIATGFSGLRRQYADPLVVLVSLTAVLLAIGCANLSGLLLTRAVARRHQLATRLALGAGRARLVQQMLVESLLVSAVGTLVAIPLAALASRALGAALWTGSAERFAISMTPDARVLGLAAIVAIGSGACISVLPAWFATRERAVVGVAQRGSASGTLSAKVLLIAQVALSLVLLVAAGLFARSLLRLRGNDAVFPTGHIVWTRLWLNTGDRGTGLDRSYFTELARQLSQIRGAESAAFSVTFPSFFNFPLPPDLFARADTADRSGGVDGLTEIVSPRFFETVGVPRLQGRDFTWDDDARHPPVAIVNATLARKLSPGVGAVGQRIRLARDAASPAVEIVGVVDDAPIGNIREPHIAVLFRPILQELQRSRVPIAHVRVAGSADMALVRDAYGKVVASLGHHFVRSVSTLEEQVNQSLLQERLIAWLSSFFAALAVLLACIGVYGVLACAVARRRSEIGIRMALGSTNSAVVRMIMGEGFALAAIGVGLGLPIALACGRLARSLLYGIGPTDPATLAGSAAAFVLVAGVAAAIPAYRAATIDPVVALRSE